MADSIPGGPIGRRLLPVTIDDVARISPERVWAILPSKSGEGWQDVTFPILANAINRMAWFMEEKLGPADGSFPTVCYIGGSDMRYLAMEMAAAKTGYKVLFSSHINTLPAHLHLLEQTSCSLLMTAAGVSIADILAARPMKHVTGPSLDDLLDSSPVPHYPFPKSFEDAQLDPFLILHTSGSTGLPKPVTYTHAVVTAQDAFDTVPPFSADEAQQKGWQRLNWTSVLAGRFASPFAPFHIITALPIMYYTVFGRSTYIFATRDGLPHAPELVNAWPISDTAWLNSSTLEEIVANPTWLDKLSRFNHIMYSGGALAPSTGEAVASKTTLVSMFGTTELGGTLLNGEVPPDEWEYSCFDPDLNGIEWRPQPPSEEEGAPELFEMVIVRDDARLATYQSVFRVFPQRQEHLLGDLWSKHPTRPHTWRYAARADDLVCFASGVKFNPTGVQDRIKAHRHVRDGLLFADGHVQVVLLVELTPAALDAIDRGDGEDVRRSIWQAVDEMNRDAPSKIATIAETHIVVAPREKPFLRASKGTVMRFHTLTAFRGEIEARYAEHGDQAAGILGRVKATDGGSN